jgi:AcrR family transcriptional regulator
MRKSALVPRKAPRQRRSQSTVEVILAAAARVLSRDSLTGFNTNRVAAVAGVSVGSLYQYFPNKASMVAALIVRAHDELLAGMRALLERTQGATLHDTLTAVAELMIEQQYGNPLYAAALDHEEQRLPIGAHLAQFGAQMLGLVEALIARHAASLSPALPRAAAADCITITRALVEADSGHSRRPPPDLAEREP